jgi:YHS domain-containing protein
VAANAKASPEILPMQANWNASLAPDVAGEKQLRSTSFEEAVAPQDSPMRSALGGFCAVELREHSRFVSGNPALKTTYQGQEFQFSSQVALEQFKTAPEKYAPVEGGNDVVLAMEEHRTVPGSTDHSAVWHGRIYLFSNSATLAAFQDDPSRYAR